MKKELQAWEKEKVISILKIDFGSEKKLRKLGFNILFTLFKKIPLKKEGTLKDIAFCKENVELLQET